MTDYIVFLPTGPEIHLNGIRYDEVPAGTLVHAMDGKHWYRRGSLETFHDPWINVLIEDVPKEVRAQALLMT